MKITTKEINMLKSAKLLCVDIETNDPLLKAKGPGTHRGDGYICGVALGANVDGHNLSYYLPLKHPDTNYEDTLFHKDVLKDVLQSNNSKIGANIIYDLEWLNHEGYTVNGGFHDVQYAEPLLDEYSRSYSLAALAKRHTNRIKQTPVLEEFNSKMGWKGEAISNLWRMPQNVVEQYALSDAELPLQIFEKQQKELERQNLMPVYDMERALIPLLLKMRQVGVRVHQENFHAVIKSVSERHYELKNQLFNWAGFEFNATSSHQLAKVLDNKGIPYPRNAPTPLMLQKGKPGNPKLDKDTLIRLSENNPECKVILDFRRYSTLINLFLHPWTELMCNDRLYCQFHPLRTDDKGTVSGRLSCSKPNLQQVSAKKEESFDQDALEGMILRKLFLPEEGYDWAKLDYSQIEYRIMAHYASGPGAEKLREEYNKNPKTDHHDYIVKQTGYDRRTAKRLNFGGAYGLGIDSAARLFRWTLDEATEFLTTFHDTSPYIKVTRNLVSRTAAMRGYIFTIMGRKARTHPSRKLYSMFNRLIQGSAADVMKKGLVDSYNKGLFDVLVPHLTVHDEMDVSFKQDNEGREALDELQHTMENAIKFDVPLLVDCHTGSNWAEAD